MIEAVFGRDSLGLCSVQVTGHADFAPEGEDVVCASVTSAVMLTANGITEALGVPARVAVGENRVDIELPRPADHGSMAFLQALHLHLTLLQQQYPGHIQLTVLEV